MINKEEAKVDAWVAIAELVGKEYFRSHFESSCQSYPDEQSDDIDYEWHGFVSKAHPFQPEDRRIVYK